MHWGRFAQPDDGIPEVPENLTEVSDAVLMELFSAYVAWQNFIDQQAVEIEIAETRAQSRKDIAVARTVIASDEKTVTRQRAHATIEVEQANEDWLVAKTNRKAIGIQKDALDRLTNLVSRELSRRIGRGPTQRRADRFQP